MPLVSGHLCAPCNNRDSLFLSPALFDSHPTDDNESLKLQYAVKIGLGSL